jgi:hypothetical protein
MPYLNGKRNILHQGNEPLQTVSQNTSYDLYLVPEKASNLYCKMEGLTQKEIIVHCL